MKAVFLRSTSTIGSCILASESVYMVMKLTTPDRYLTPYFVAAY